MTPPPTSAGLASVFSGSSAVGPRTRSTTYLDPDTWFPVLTGRRGELVGEHSTYPEEILDAVDLDAFNEGKFVKPIDLGEVNVLFVRFPPGYHVPRHSHNCDQLVTVVEGELRHGNRRLGPGQSYFTPAGVGYATDAGPEGLTIMEVRTTPLAEMRTTFLERDPSHWGPKPWSTGD
jgi:quercetin dioxygenase-like cupin family protein